jgi:hypothetical protein
VNESSVVKTSANIDEMTIKTMKTKTNMKKMNMKTTVEDDGGR